MRSSRGLQKSAKTKSPKRLLVLCTTTGYQAKAFVEAAKKLELAVVLGTDRCHVLEDPWQDGSLPLRFENPQEAAGEIVRFASSTPIHGLVALGDRPTPAAAYASQALHLPYHSPEAAETCRDKYRVRQRLQAAGLKVPSFIRVSIDQDPQEVLTGVYFPCVLKPLALAASRGVIRANKPEEFVSAFRRIQALLCSPEVQALREETSNFVQVEAFIEGEEVALEGLLDKGRLKSLALFDKPDPLEGPFFEETIYVTPSRLPPETQAEILSTVAQALRALGLSHGPLHAELRVNREGSWILEVAARSIGGLCSRALRFLPDLSLEELLIRQALGLEVMDVARETSAAGVMMIPIPSLGLYEGVEGVEEAQKVPGIEEIVMTAKPEQKLVPWPEGSSYLGFIFARAATPDQVEDALREAHRKLRILINPVLPTVQTRAPSAGTTSRGRKEQE